MFEVKTVLWIFLVSLLHQFCNGQFPLLCVDNITLPEAVCCPTPPGFDEPCGGPERGRCVYLEPTNEDFSPRFQQLHLDDRLDWPRRFFSYGCQCTEKFEGYMCQDCNFAYKGKECNEKKLVIRRNAMSLSKKERRRFRDLVVKSKEVKSDYVLTLNVEDIDPTTDFKYSETSVYDYYMWAHAYTLRTTMIHDIPDYCKIYSEEWPGYNFAHQGPNFPNWHRILVLKYERELQKLANDEDFAIPYWNWLDQGRHCGVCINDLVGKSDMDKINSTLDPGSPFSKWKIVCAERPGFKCLICNYSYSEGLLQRFLLPSGSFPVRDEYDFMYKYSGYDMYPYESGVLYGFRAALEGNVNKIKVTTGQEAKAMHNRLHDSFGYPFQSVPASLNDPIFYLHHNFVDLQLERYIRMHNANASFLPERGAPAGHNRDAPIVPWFPRISAPAVFRDSRDNGYDFDTLEQPPRPRKADNTIHVLIVVLSSMVCVFIAVALVMGIYCGCTSGATKGDKERIINKDTPSTTYESTTEN